MPCMSHKKNDKIDDQKEKKRDNSEVIAKKLRVI